MIIGYNRYLPDFSQLDTYIALALITLGFLTVFGIEKLGNKALDSSEV